jgi:two-component system nitrate/nitrite sensor histidine kinase NarX
MPEPITPEPDANADDGSRAARAGPRAQTQAVRLARKTQSLDILYEIATSLSQPGSLEQLLDGFLDTFIELIDARAASVRLATADGNTRLIASRGLAPEVVESDRVMPMGSCPCGWTASEGGLRIQSGTASCAGLIGRPMLERDCIEFVVVPVQHQDRILGVYNLFLDRPLTAMGEDMRDLLISVGRHLGLAIEKARLEGEARRLAIMEERNIIGNELHDSLAQSLIGMRLQLKILSESLARKDFSAAQYEAKGLRRAMTQANADLRDLLTNYRLKIDEAGFAQTVANLVERFRRETGISVFFQNECQAFALTPAQEIQVYYIIQEALTNIRKHSSARNVRIMLNNEGDLYTVLIEDDGLGMDGAAGGTPGEHAGLAIMRERTERLPGQFVIESEPGEGTRIVLIFNAPPLAAPANAARG